MPDFPEGVIPPSSRWLYSVLGGRVSVDDMSGYRGCPEGDLNPAPGGSAAEVAAVDAV